MESIEMEQREMRSPVEVQELTAEYASYAATKSGLAKVLVALVCTIVWLLNSLVGRGIFTAVVTITLTLTWLVGKEIIRKVVYQSFGNVREHWTTQRLRVQFRWAIFMAIVAASMCIWFILVYLFMGTISLFGLFLGLAFAAGLPFVAWRTFNDDTEFLVGIWLWVCCAICSIGTVLVVAPGWSGLVYTVWVPFYSIILLGRGLKEHRAYLRLANRLNPLSE